MRANDTFASDHFDSNLESDQVARYTTGDTLTILTLFGAPARIPTPVPVRSFSKSLPAPQGQRTWVYRLSDYEQPGPGSELSILLKK